jgi:hypothetical protein
VWLLVLGYAAVAATLLWYSRAEKDTYMLKYLSLALWGVVVMSFIDHLYGYLTEGGEFLDTSPDALLLGFSMLLVALVAWLLALLVKDPRGVLRKRAT